MAYCTYSISPDNLVPVVMSYALCKRLCTGVSSQSVTMNINMGIMTF